MITKPGARNIRAHVQLPQVQRDSRLRAGWTHENLKDCKKESSFEKKPEESIKNPFPLLLNRHPQIINTWRSF
jgi:hypothetical protein